MSTDTDTERPVRGEGESAEAYVARIREAGQAARADIRGFRGQVLDGIASNAKTIERLEKAIGAIAEDLSTPVVHAAPSYRIAWQGESLSLSLGDVQHLTVAHQISAGLGAVDVRLENGETLNQLAIGDIENILQMVLNAERS